MGKTVSLFVLAILCSTQQEMHAQDGYFANWFDRVDKTRGEQTGLDLANGHHDGMFKRRISIRSGVANQCQWHCH